MERELAVADARCQTLGKPSGGILAIGRHQLRKGCKQAGLGEAVAVNPVKPGLSPGFRMYPTAARLWSWSRRGPTADRVWIVMASERMAAPHERPATPTLSWFTAEATTNFKIG